MSPPGAHVTSRPFVKVSARPPPLSKKTTPRSELTAAMPVEPSRRRETDGAPNQGDPTRPSAVMSAAVAVSPVRTIAQKRSASTQATSSRAAGCPRIRSRSAADTSSSARPSGRPANSSPPRTKVGLPSAARAKAQSSSLQAASVTVKRHGLARPGDVSANARPGSSTARSVQPSSPGWVTRRRPPASADASSAEASRVSASSATASGPSSPRQSRSRASRPSWSSGGPATPGRKTKTPPSAATAAHRSSGDQAIAR